MNELEILAKRCEEASGPDRELDDEVRRQIWHLRREGDHCWWDTPRGPMPISADAPRYTASLDAAMTLIPERYSRDVGLHISPMSIDMGGKDYKAALGGAKNRASARSFALALAAAALRARALTQL